MIASATHPRETEILREAQQALTNQLFHLRQTLTCEFRGGMLLLRGRVSSYYHKQVAQEAVLRLDAVEQVINQIEVISA
jgi:osmotically-inducible protein OsmY